MVQNAAEALNEHIRQMTHWHFSENTGSKYWLKKMREFNFNPLTEIHGLDDIVEKFPPFDDDSLKKNSLGDWKPKGFPKGTGFSMYQTGGTTGSPSRRIGRRGMGADESDFADDYIHFAKHLRKRGFNNEGLWLYLGPGGPRRLQRGVEVLADEFGADLVSFDMDAGWCKNDKNVDPEGYMRHLTESAISALRRDKPVYVFCPPNLIQRVGQLFDWSKSGVKAVFAGGTAMPPDVVRSITEEHFGERVIFEPAFGNALVGLAFSRPFGTEKNPIDGQVNYQLYYHPNQPSTVVRVTKKGSHLETVEYDEYGYISISAFTKEWFMPNKIEERDYGMRVAPTEEFPWDGFSNVHIPKELQGKIKTGVY